MLKEPLTEGQSSSSVVLSSLCQRIWHPVSLVPIARPLPVHAQRMLLRTLAGCIYSADLPKPACIVGCAAARWAQAFPGPFLAPSPDRPCVRGHRSALVCMPRRRRIPRAARYSAVGQRSKHLPLYRGTHLHAQGCISIIKSMCIPSSNRQLGGLLPWTPCLVHTARKSNQRTVSRGFNTMLAPCLLRECVSRSFQCVVLIS